MDASKLGSDRMARKSQHLKKSNYKILKVSVLLIIAVLAVFGMSEYFMMKNAASKISNNYSAKDQIEIKKGRPFSVLVMGTDVGALGRSTSYAGNTDTMELLTVNPTTRRITMTAIPRDTLVKVNTKKGADYVKINAAYPIGGAKLAKKQVRELLDVPVNYYALVNMGMLEKVVDAVGGVEVDNPFKFTFDGHTYPKGKQKLNGKEALGYSRMRYDDPDNDYGRQKRGQQILLSAINKFKQHGNLVMANQILEAVKDDVRTDVPLDNFTLLYKNYFSAMKSSENDVLRGKDAKIDGVDFQVATTSEINRVSKKVRRALGLKPVKVVNAETKMVEMQTTWNGYNNVEFTLPNGAKYNTPGSGK